MRLHITAFRVVKFIVDGSVGSVSDNQDSISDLLSTITGGVAEIQDIQAFSGQPGTLGTLNIDRIDRGEEGGREARGQEAEDKSVVDVFIRYPATSVVDVEAIKQKLASATGGRTSRMEAERQKIGGDFTLIKILAGILSALLIIVIIFILCCCCPSKCLMSND